MSDTIVIKDKQFATWIRKIQGEYQTLTGKKYTYKEILWSYITGMSVEEVKQLFEQGEHIPFRDLPSPLMEDIPSPPGG